MKKPVTETGFQEQTESSKQLAVYCAGQFFQDLAAFYFINDLLVFWADWAATCVIFSSVQASLLNVPSCNFQVLIYVHFKILYLY